MKKLRLRKEVKEWAKAIIETPLVIAAFYAIYCMMYVVIGG